LKQSKGTGASGSFKIGEVVKPKKKPAANSPFKGYPNSSKRILVAIISLKRKIDLATKVKKKYSPSVNFCLKPI
jgi:hypothetical protein